MIGCDRFKMADDIELDSESLQSDLGSGQAPVRKTINLKLKTSKTKAKTKSSKQQKAKAEKKVSTSKETRENELKPSSSSTNQKFAHHHHKELDWNQPIVFVGEKVEDPMIHICEGCSLPVLVYGRLNPCKHVFCLTCAEKARKQCPRCESHIERIEPAGIGQIYICSFGGSRHGVSGCRRSYLSQRDLLAHVRHRHQRDGAQNLDVDMKPTEYQQGMPMPFLGQSYHPTAAPHPMGIGMPRQVRMENYPMMAGLPMPDAMFHGGSRMHGAAQFGPLPPQQFPSQVNPQQPPFHPEQSHIPGMSHFLPRSSAGPQFAGGPALPPPQDSNAAQYLGGGLHQAAMLAHDALTPNQRTGVPHSRADPRGHAEGVWHVGNPLPGMVHPPEEWPPQRGLPRYPPQQFYK